VKVLSHADYTAWVDARKKEMAAAADDPGKTWDMPALVARGEAVYNANCAVCHRPDGKGAGPIKPLDGSAVVRDADKSKALAIVHNGAGGGAMPAWRGKLSETEIAAVVTFTKNAWSNKTGQVVQPAEAAAAQ
jgi:cytochrome c oxidase subunit II